MMHHFSRRAWLAHNGTAAALLTVAPARIRHFHSVLRRTLPSVLSATAGIEIDQTACVSPTVMQDLAVRAVDAATSAGATYADARLSRVVTHRYGCGSDGVFKQDIELVGIGVRALVRGYWGFAASPFWTLDEVAQLAKNAVAQAKANAKGSARTVELGHIPVPTGAWATPIKIDPFTVSIEEKCDTIAYWKERAEQAGFPFKDWGIYEGLAFVRHERALATSDGGQVTQTTYESSGHIQCQRGGNGLRALSGGGGPSIPVQGIGVAGKGWELFVEADLPGQFLKMAEQAKAGGRTAGGVTTAQVGQYTIVCDGATMASLVNETIGVGTQLDRALGYEANAGGTSFIDNPLAMVGTAKIASPLVTITTNRSAPAQLATVKWDDEGVEPPEATLIKDGVLTDFQTTREQAAWLAPYYQKRGRPVTSNGCAAGETALAITMQHMPNLAMTPNVTDVQVDDLIANVSHGIFIEQGDARCDFQARGGILRGNMREIRNGRLGRGLQDGAVLFDTVDLWKKVVAIAGISSQGGIERTQYDWEGRQPKGQPSQATSHSVRAVAAIITEQPLINPSRKA